jgi:hypothetical protein
VKQVPEWVTSYGTTGLEPPDVSTVTFYDGIGVPHIEMWRRIERPGDAPVYQSFDAFRPNVTQEEWSALLRTSRRYTYHPAKENDADD